MRSAAVCDHLGITYRQLDHLTRNGVVDPRHLGPGGSGSHRIWPPEVVARMEVARALERVCPSMPTAGPGGHLWTALARLVMEHHEDPPPAGWVVLDDLGQLHYCVTDADRSRALAGSDGGIVARYALTAAPSA